MMTDSEIGASIAADVREAVTGSTITLGKLRSCYGNFFDENGKFASERSKCAALILASDEEAVKGFIECLETISQPSVEHSTRFLVVTVCWFVITGHNDMTEAVTKAGISKYLTSLISFLIESLSDEQEASISASTGQILNCVLGLLWGIAYDTAGSFSRGKALASDHQLRQALGKLMRIMTQDLSHVSALETLSSVCTYLLKSIKSPEQIELTMAEISFPAAIINLYKRSQNLSLACMLLQCYRAHPKVGAQLSQTNIVSYVCDTFASSQAEEDQVKKAGSALWNGSNCYSGAVALIPHLAKLQRWFQPALADNQRFRPAGHTISNICRYVTEDERSQLRAQHLDDTLLNFFNERVAIPEDVEVQVMCSIANLIGQVEDHPAMINMKTDTRMLSLLLAELRHALRGEDSEGGRSEPFEPLQALANLAVSDQNKPLLDKMALEAVLVIFSGDVVDERTELYALRLLVNLSLAAKNLENFQKHKQTIHEIFRKSEKSGLSPDARREASQGAFQLDQQGSVATKNALKRVASLKSSNGPIMISYPWKYKKLMLMVRDWLIAAGHEVWMDVDSMHKADNILEAMSAAIEKASVVIVCLCEEYKESTSCRLEGQYAQTLNKPIIPIRPESYKPTGWLGLVTASTLWHDMFDDEDDDPEIKDKLLSTIERHTSASSATSVTRGASAALAPVSEAGSGPASPTKSHASSGQSTKDLVKELSAKVEHLQEELAQVATELKQSREVQDTQTALLEKLLQNQNSSSSAQGCCVIS